MYASCSENYWRERKKPDKIKKWKLIATFTLPCLFLFVFTVRLKTRNHAEKMSNISRSLVRPQPNEFHFERCKERIVLSQPDCSNLCNNERKSIPRPLMHQSCMHGCTSSFLASFAIGCEEGDEAKAFNSIGTLGYEDCSKYKNLEPQPIVFSTCRKYHRMGIKAGIEMGSKVLNDLLDEEWASSKSRMTEV